MATEWKTEKKEKNMDKQIHDMTEGAPLKHIIAFALPLIIGNAFQQIYNMVDSIIVGNYVGTGALAAVGACASPNWFFLGFTGGMSIGAGVLVSQYFGAGDEEKVKSAIGNAVYVLSGVAILCALIGIMGAPVILRLLHTPETVIGQSIIYMRITCAGIVVMALYNGVASILRALGDSKTPLIFLVVSCIINISMDLLFVVVLNMGVMGVAVATVIAQAVAGVSCLIYAITHVSYFRLDKEQFRPNNYIIKKTIQLGIPVGFQSSLIAISIMALQGVVNSFGESVMATYTITGKLDSLISLPYMSVASALTTFTGQNVGKGNIERVKKCFKQCLFICAIFSLMMLPISIFLGADIISIFTKDQTIIEMGATAVLIVCPFYFPLGLIYMPRGVMNGAGDARFSTINGITEIICRIGFSQLLTRIPEIGFWGVWGTTGATWFTVAIVCLLRYHSGKWKYKSVV